jgi:tetratricopeptide (TPR) repeat protein
MEGAKPSGQTLPSKEATIYKQVVRYYDAKQFTKALKNCEKILEKCPEHADTLAMKGLTLSHLGKRDESFDAVKEALRRNLKSAMCWHSLGLLHKADRNYAEASKAFQQACKIDPENPTLQRDLSLLFLQLREFDKFRDLRQQLLAARPTFDLNWIVYAVSEYLVEDPDKAASVIVSILKTFGTTFKKYEISELILFRAKALDEAGRQEDAINYLNEQQDAVLDKLAYYEHLVKLHIGRQNLSTAAELAHKLIEINPENTLYHDSFIQAKLQSDHLSILEEYKALAQKFPHSNAIQRAPLDLDLPSPQFAELMDKYLMPRLRKGIVALGSDLKPLYKNSQKVAAIQSILLTHKQVLATSSAFARIDNYESFTFSPSDLTESSTSLLWTLLLLSHHYYRKGDYQEALNNITDAINHTPTVPDLYIVRAKIYKKLGDNQKAADSADEGRKLDLGDRFLNNKAVKFRLRNNETEAAEQLMGLFSKEQGDELNVHDMQCMWYEIEKGEAHLRRNEVSEAVKELSYIETHLTDMFEGQYEFHLYCMRKMALRSYVDLLQFTDKLYNEKKYLRAGLALLQCNIRDSAVFPYEKARALVLNLVKYHDNSLELHEYAFTMFLREGKILLALKSLLRLKALGSAHYTSSLEAFQKTVSGAEVSSTVSEVLTHFQDRLN